MLLLVAVALVGDGGVVFVAIFLLLLRVVLLSQSLKFLGRGA